MAIMICMIKMIMISGRLLINHDNLDFHDHDGNLDDHGDDGNPPCRVFQVDAIQPSPDLPQVPAQQVIIVIMMRSWLSCVDDHWTFARSSTKMFRFSTNSVLFRNIWLKISRTYNSTHFRNMRKLVIGFTVFVMSLSCLVSVWNTIVRSAIKDTFNQLTPQGGFPDAINQL